MLDMREFAKNIFKRVLVLCHYGVVALLCEGFGFYTEWWRDSICDGICYTSYWQLDLRCELHSTGVCVFHILPIFLNIFVFLLAGLLFCTEKEFDETWLVLHCFSDFILNQYGRKLKKQMYYNVPVHCREPLSTAAISNLEFLSMQEWFSSWLNCVHVHNNLLISSNIMAACFGKMFRGSSFLTISLIPQGKTRFPYVVVTRHYNPSECSPWLACLWR